MKVNGELAGMPKSFKDEKKELINNGITSWHDLKNLKEGQIVQLVKTGRSTVRNLKRIKGIANLICDLGVEPFEAALLMHSGLATISALAKVTPQEVLQKTGRLERQLLNRNQNLINLNKANEWIKRAKDLHTKTSKKYKSTNM